MPPDREERFLGEHDSVRRSPRTVNAFNYFQNLDFFVKNVRTLRFLQARSVRAKISQDGVTTLHLFDFNIH